MYLDFMPGFSQRVRNRPILYHLIQNKLSPKFETLHWNSLSLLDKRSIELNMFLPKDVILLRKSKYFDTFGHSYRPWNKGVYHSIYYNSKLLGNL